MKHLILILGFLISTSTFTFCQDREDKQATSNLLKDLVKKQSNSDAVTFGGYLSAMWQFVGRASNTITFQPRIFDLDTLFFSRNISIDTNYARIAWERNIQLNIGFAPNTRNLFARPANCQVGLSFAVINNKEIPLKDYSSTIFPYERYVRFQSYLNDLAEAGDSVVRAKIRNSINTQNYSNLPEFLKDSVRKKFQMPIEKMMGIPKYLVDSLAKILPRRPLLVIDINGIHGLGNRGESGLSFTTSFSTYAFEHHTNVDPQFSFAASYSLSDDTTLPDVNLSRSTMEISAGINIILFSKFDFKPGVSYTNILSGIYTKENQTSWSPTASLHVKIAEKLVMAFNWSYDSDKSTSTTNIKLKTSLE